MQADLPRRLAAEALGIGLLAATVVGSGIMADLLTDDLALALLCNALPTGAILVVLITILAPLSGAHFNPAVTLVFALQREIETRSAVAYVAAQIVGGILGALIAHAMFELPIWQASTTVRSGSAQWLAEGVAAFGLVFTILAGLRFRPDAIPWLVGLYITAAYWFTASTSFANPAVAPVHQMVAAVDEAGLFGEQEAREGRDLARGTEPVCRVKARKLRKHRLVQVLGQQRCVNKGGADRVHPYVAVGVFEGSRLSQTMSACLQAT
jgi:glycerol uptake facilitator-like aquaporin